MKRVIYLSVAIATIVLSLSGCVQKSVPTASNVCTEGAAPYSLEEIEKSYHCSHRG